MLKAHRDRPRAPICSRAMRSMRRTTAFVVAMGCLALAAPASGSVAPCTPQYEASTVPALQVVVPSKIAYGRKVNFAVNYDGESPEHYVSGDEATPATLTIHSAKGEPFADSEAEIVGKPYFLEPERSEGSQATITLTYDEASYEPEPSTCSRTVTKTVRFVTGSRPTIFGPISHGGDTSFKVETHGEQCALTRPGRLTVWISGPEKTGRLSLTDACEGRWTHRISGDEWELEGGLKPSVGFNTTVDFSAFGSVIGTRHFAITFAFRGHPFYRESFDVRVSERVL